MEKSGKIVRDNDTRDIFYYRNAFALVTTKVIKECLLQTEELVFLVSSMVGTGDST